MSIRDYLEEFEDLYMDETFTREEQSRISQSLYSYVIQLSTSRNVEIEMQEDGYLEIENIDI